MQGQYGKCLFKTSPFSLALLIKKWESRNKTHFNIKVTQKVEGVEGNRRKAFKKTEF